ncbi:LysM peptidoglycan-binding domain-containing protein [bacterium]|nr:LysM peptidoglycan-binding domain-containing protein [bacterium]
MRRTMVNELLVALIVIAVLGFAVAFGVLLSSTGSDPEPTGIAERTDSVGAESNVGLEATPTITPRITLTPYTIPTLLVDLSMGTLVSASSSETPPEISPVPSRTPSETPTLTVAAVTTTSPDELLATPTLTATATATVTASATATIVPATATASMTPSPIATSTRTPFPVETSGILPTPTLLPVTDLPPGLSTPDSTVCIPPVNWVTYVVQPGDTLFSIGLAVRSSVNELRSTNCLPDVDRILVGDVLYVPRSPARPVQTSGAVPAGLAPVGCAFPGVRITSPEAGQGVTGLFTVIGSASLPDFDYYKIEVRLDAATIYNFIAQFTTPVIDGVLGQIDSSLFNPGIHWLRLTVVDRTGNVPAGATCVVPVRFE